jgi:hypothetical protein
MSVLNHLAQAAAMLLLIEVIVVVLIIAGVGGGLGFGLHWVRGKVDWASAKANSYIAIGRKYLRIGTDYAAKPFIVTSGASETAKGTLEALRQQALRNRLLPRESGTVGARPVQAETTEETEAAVPLV